MFQADNTKSRLLFLFAAIALMVVFVFALLYLLGADPKEDPTIKASYKSLSKKLVHESPLPVELTADFQLTNEGRWVANGPVTDRELQKLAKKQQFLDNVQVIGGEITADGIAILKERHIRKLKLHYVELDDKFLETISTFSDLETLDLRNESIDDKLISHLTGLPKLENLHVRQSKITQQGVEHIIKTFPKLDDVGISDDPNFDDACFFLLKGLKKLRNVDVSGTAVTEGALLKFLKTSSIEELGIGSLNLDDSIVTKLPTNLESLDLSYNPITDASIEALPRFKKLETFRLVGRTQVTVKALQRLQQRLPGCSIFTTKKPRNKPY